MAGTVPKPPARDLASSRQVIIDVIFGPPDPQQPPWTTVYADMRDEARKTYDEIIKPESDDNIEWKNLAVGLQERAMQHLIENSKFRQYHEVAKDHWLTEHILKTYIKSHLAHVKKKQTMGLESPPAEEGSSPSRPSAASPKGKTQQISLPSLREFDWWTEK